LFWFFKQTSNTKKQAPKNFHLSSFKPQKNLVLKKGELAGGLFLGAWKFC